MGGDSLGAISHKLRGNPPVSLVLPVSLLIGFPERGEPQQYCNLKLPINMGHHPMLVQFPRFLGSLRVQVPGDVKHAKGRISAPIVWTRHSI